jgi:hypothetical protein
VVAGGQPADAGRGVQDGLRSLTYVSRAARGITEADLRAINEISIVLNAIGAITGFLVFDGMAFTQIIEGAAVPLAALLQKLLRDKRHYDLTIVDEREIELRSFGDWSMKMVSVSPGQAIGLDDIEGELGPSVQPDIRAMLVGTMTVMRDLA